MANDTNQRLKARQVKGPALARSLALATLILASVCSVTLAQNDPAATPAPNTAPAADAAAATPPPEILAEPVDPDKLNSSISGGLDWLAAQQITTGSDAGGWPGGTFPTAVTSLAGLAFLAHGELPGEGRHAKTLELAIENIKRSMTPDGYLGTRGNSMYVHAISTLFAVSYLGLSKDPQKEAELAQWCRRAIDVIIEAQKVRKSNLERGGWRYSPDSNESDLSVTSWQLLALLAAKQCGYDIDQQVIDDALRFMNSAYVESGANTGFLYRPGVSKDPEPGVTGTAIAIKTLLERTSDPRLPKAIAFLDRYPPAWGGQQYKGFYYSVSFYMVQGYFQLGPKSWRKYGPAVQRILVEHQSGDGHWPFPPDGDLESRATSPAYSTAMALLILGMDNQYLPMYQRQSGLFGGSH